MGFIKKYQKQIVMCITGLAILAQIVFVMIVQNHYAFMLEDISYSKNLKTGEALTNIFQIIPNIGRILGGRGGSVLSLSLLSFIVLVGEGFANVLNMLVMLLISYLISRVAGAKYKDLIFVALPFFLLITLNGDWEYTYFWEFGIVNFVFPAVNFLIYLFLIVKAVETKKEARSFVSGIVLCVAAFLCAWANGAYGLVVIMVGGIAFVFCKRLLKISVPNRLLLSLASAGVGCLMYLAAAGNFKEDSVMGTEYISYSIFPGVVLAVLLLAIVLRAGSFISISQMLMTVVLFGCVILKFILGWLPGISINGIEVCTLILSITLICSFLVNIRKEYPKKIWFVYLLAGSVFLYSISLMLGVIGGVS